MKRRPVEWIPKDGGHSDRANGRGDHHHHVLVPSSSSSSSRTRRRSRDEHDDDARRRDRDQRDDRKRRRSYDKDETRREIDEGRRRNPRARSRSLEKGGSRRSFEPELQQHHNKPPAILTPNGPALRLVNVMKSTTNPHDPRVREILNEILRTRGEDFSVIDLSAILVKLTNVLRLRAEQHEVVRRVVGWIVRVPLHRFGMRSLKNVFDSLYKLNVEREFQLALLDEILDPRNRHDLMEDIIFLNALLSKMVLQWNLPKDDRRLRATIETIKMMPREKFNFRGTTNILDSLFKLGAEKPFQIRLAEAMVAPENRAELREDVIVVNSLLSKMVIHWRWGKSDPRVRVVVEVIRSLPLRDAERVGTRALISFLDYLTKLQTDEELRWAIVKELFATGEYYYPGSPRREEFREDIIALNSLLKSLRLMGTSASDERVREVITMIHARLSAPSALSQTKFRDLLDVLQSLSALETEVEFQKWIVEAIYARMEEFGTSPVYLTSFITSLSRFGAEDVTSEAATPRFREILSLVRALPIERTPTDVIVLLSRAIERMGKAYDSSSSSTSDLLETLTKEGKRRIGEERWDGFRVGVNNVEMGGGGEEEEEEC